MAASTPALGERPSPVSRTSDWMVLALVIAALLGGWLLRQQGLFATTPVELGSLRFAAPANSIPLSSGTEYEANTRDGLTLRVTTQEAPNIRPNEGGTETGVAATAGVTGTAPVTDTGTMPAPSTVTGADVSALLAGRALTLGREREMFQTISGEAVEVDGQPAALMEYAYVDNEGDFFSSSLSVIHGYEVLIVEGGQLYALSMEGPDDQWETVQAAWPRLMRSVRVGGQ